MKISIIIPIYQAENFLEECLDSIVNQTWRNIEVILINDGSTDKSGKICDYYANLDNRIVVIHQVNSGVSFARNKGIEIASGDYILFVDADDWIELDWCEKIAELSDNDADIIVFDYFENDRKSVRKQYFYYTKKQYFRKNASKKSCDIKYLQESMLCPSIAPMYQSTYTIGVPWGKAYKRDVIKAHGLCFDEKLPLNEDVIFNLYALENCTKILYIPEPMYYYRIFAESSMRKIDSDTTKAIIVRLEIINRFNQIREDFPSLKRAILGKQWLLLKQCIAFLNNIKDNTSEINELVKSQFIVLSKQKNIPFKMRVGVYLTVVLTNKQWLIKS